MAYPSGTAVTAAMPMRFSPLLKRTLAGYLIAAICMASLLNAHVHLAENHAGANVHSHAAEVHFAHFPPGHDSIDGGAAGHSTDAIAVDLNGADGSTLCKILEVAALLVAIFFLRVASQRTGQRFSSPAKAPRFHPYYSPLQARAPPLT